MLPFFTYNIVGSSSLREGIDMFQLTEDTKRKLYNICMVNKDLLLVDVMNHLHRFLWANQDLSVTINDEIVSTGHLYGMTRFVSMLKERFPDCSIVLCLDGYDSERREINPEYKANRDHTLNLYEQIDDLVEMCSLLDGVYSCYCKDCEADDIINSISFIVYNLCKKAKVRKSIWILSNDKDMYQLVRDDTDNPIRIIRKFGTGAKWYDDADIVDESKVRETFNDVNPINLVKFRAITGDSSDNLKGYYRFRKKDASVIAESYDYSLENHSLVLKEGIVPDIKIKKSLVKIMNEIDIFDKNYRIMKMKQIDFDLKEHDFSNKDELYKVLDKISLYDLDYYKRRLMSGSGSKYRREIINYYTGDGKV